MKFVKSSLLVKIIILILAVYATVTLVRLRAQIASKNAEATALTGSIVAAEQENRRLQDAIDELDSDDGVKAVARGRMDMTSEGEITFFDVNH